jgi:hypothetical protein
MLLLPAQKFLKRLLDSVRRNSKLTKSGHLGRWHIVDLHQFHLIPGDRRTWHHLRDPRQCFPSAKWNRNQDALQPCFASDSSEKLLVSIDARAAAFECDCVCFCPLRRSDDGLGYIFHLGRLQSCHAVAEHWVDWKAL